MGRGEEGQRKGAEDGAGHRHDAPASMRQGELPVRRGRGTARAGHLELLRTEPGPVGEPAGRAGRAGARGDRTLPGGPPEVGGGGERRPRDTGGPARAAGVGNAFRASAQRYSSLVEFLGGEVAAALTHAELEERLRTDGFELLRQLLQDHLDVRSSGEERLETVNGADGIRRGNAEADHDRPLVTVFGEVRVRRLSYRHKGAANLHPADRALNLPGERYSHGLRALAATEAARGSFEEAVAAIDRTTAAAVPKRQVEALARSAAVDFEAFFDTTARPVPEKDDVIVLSCDCKGIVMRPDGLRPTTAAKAANARTKLKGRLSKGEKANRKRIAE